MPSVTNEDIVRSLGVRFDGTVTNAATGAPIAGAAVTTQGVTRTTFTNGIFLFLGDAQSGDGLRTGVFHVVVGRDGFIEVREDVTFRATDTVRNFQLQPTR
jgi:hypothetical protein